MIGIKLTAALVLVMGSRYVEGAADWYAGSIYPLFVSTVGRVMGWFPFSVIEILLYSLIVVVGIRTSRMVRRIRSEKEMWKGIIGAELIRLLSAGSTLFLIYMLTCGVNYYRASFAEVYDMHTDGYETAYLLELIDGLTEDVNTYGELVPRNEQGETVTPENLNALAVQAMEKLAEDYEVFEGYYPRPKALFVSEILSYQNLSGIYSPFTVEANYNGDMMGYNMPFTACHELSHLRGFMREDEANFIAYLACVNSEEPVFQYGGSLLAWIHAMNALYRTDPELHAEIYEGVSEHVLTDLRANRAFWDSYKGRVAELADRVNDTYLKANGQEHGVQSYGRMVNLLIYHYLEE